MTITIYMAKTSIYLTNSLYYLGTEYLIFYNIFIHFE